ncbi:hypothetical protein TSST111916_15910 [Tsukamurella strandjordii]|uniref:hypothetical protein n=1 Tax=Tsukamurella TaxID=2060 RepID=UPI002106C0E1|nr:hypothetical protein [Tsukamurella sp. TY48]
MAEPDFPDELPDVLAEGFFGVVRGDDARGLAVDGLVARPVPPCAEHMPRFVSLNE